MRTPEIERGKADGELAVVRRHIERWEDAHLVTHEQVGALLEFETAGGTATPRRVSDTVGAPIALLLSGVLMVALALVASRLRRFTR